MRDDFRGPKDERASERKSDLEAQLDELGDNPGQIGDRSAGQAGDSQALSSEEDGGNDSVEELAGTEQALEATTVEGVEDAADHPERAVQYGRPDDVPPNRNRNAA